LIIIKKNEHFKCKTGSLLKIHAPNIPKEVALVSLLLIKQVQIADSHGSNRPIVDGHI